jgi:hypothetical protein
MQASERDAFYQGSIRKTLELGDAQEAKMRVHYAWFYGLVTQVEMQGKGELHFIAFGTTTAQQTELQKKKLISLIMTLLQFDYALRK